MEKKDNIVKEGFGQRFLKRFGFLALILIFNCGIILGLCVNKHVSQALEASATASSTTVTLQAVSDFEIQGVDKCIGLSESGKTKIGDSNFIVKFPAIVTQIGSTENSTAMFDADLKGKVVGLDFSIATNLTTIGKGVFSGLTSLESVTIPKSVTTIYEDAFRGCSALKKVVIAQDSVLNTIGDRAFSGTKLCAIELPDSVNVLGSSDTECNAFGTAYVVSSNLQKLEYFKQHGVDEYSCALKVELRFKKGETETKTEYKLAFYMIVQNHWLCYNDGEWYVDQSYELPDTDKGCWYGSFHGTSETKYDIDTLTASVLNLKSDIYKSDVKPFEFTFKPFLTTADPSIALESAQLMYTRNPQAPQINTTLNAETDFDVTYYKQSTSGSQYNKADPSEVVSVGKYYVMLTGKGKYCGETRLDFTIEKASLADGQILFKSDDATWQGYNKDVKLQVLSVATSNGVQLYSNEYTVSYRSSTYNYTTVGAQVTVTVTANTNSNFTGSATKKYSITARSIENVTVTGYAQKVPYSGTELVLYDTLVVTDEDIDYELIFNEDYTIFTDPRNTKEVGTVTVQLNGKYRYKDTKTFTYEIEALDLTEQIEIKFYEYFYQATYDTKPHGRVYLYWLSEGKDLPLNWYTVTYSRDGETLDIKNYEETSGGFIDAGTIDIKIELTYNYTGTLTTQFVIHTRNMSDGVFKGGEADTTFCNQKITPKKYLEFSSIDKDRQPFTFIIRYSTTDSLYSTSIERLSGEGGSENLINAGKFKVTFTGIKNYTGEASYTYEIYPRELTEDDEVMIRIGDDDNDWTAPSKFKVDYTGEPIEIDAFVYVLGMNRANPSSENGGLTLTYNSDHTNAGTVTVTINGAKNYTGSIQISFEILPIEIKYLGLKKSGATYTGNSFEGEIVDYVQGGASYRTLVENRDYTLIYTRDGEITSDFTSAGTIAVEVRGTKSCIIPEGKTIKKEFVISQYKITQDNAKIQLSFDEIEWRPNNYRLYPTITSCTLVDGEGQTLFNLYTKDYDCEYSNSEIGYVSIYITGKGNFKGEAHTEYHILRRPMCINNITIEGLPNAEDIIYTGKEIVFENIRFIDNFGNGQTYELVLQHDFNYRYEANVNAGVASIIFYANTYGNYSNCEHEGEELVFHFTINKLPITSISVTENALNKSVYDTRDHKEFWSVSDKFGGYVLTSNVDAKYFKDGQPTSFVINAGTYTVVVTGKGNYCGEVTCEFTLKRANMSGGTLKLLNGETVTFSNKDTIRLTQVEITLPGQSQRNIGENEYEVIYERLTGEGGKTDIKNVGTIKVTVRGKETGNYEGEISTTYEITPLLINNNASFTFTRVGSSKRFTYTGEEIKITDYTFKFGDYDMVRGKDYEERYTSNVNVGYASLYLEGRGNYSGSHYYSFIIDPADITDLQIEVDEEQYPFFAGRNVMDHQAEVVNQKYKGQGNIRFENRVLTEADVNSGDAITLSWTFVPTSGNFNEAHGTYTIERGVFIRLSVSFGFVFNQIVVGQPIDFVHVFKDVVGGSEEIFDGFTITVKNSLGNVVTSLDEAGQYSVEVKATNPKYIISSSANSEFYVNARENFGDDNSDIRVTFENGSGDGVEFVHERINDEYIMRDILGYNYSEKVHHIEHVSFKRDEQLVFIQNAKIFLENNNNYEVYLYRPEVMINMSMRNSGASSFALVYNNDSMINITDLIRNNQPIDFSGSEAYLVFQIAEHDSHLQSGENNSSFNPIIFIAIGAVAIVAIIATSIVVVKIKKKKKIKQ